MSKGTKNFGSLSQKLGEILGLEKKFSPPPHKTETYDFRNFLHTALKLNCLKTLKILSKNPRRKLVKFRILYLTRLPGYVGV